MLVPPSPPSTMRDRLRPRKRPAAQKAMMRIYRGLRFSADKTPTSPASPPGGSRARTRGRPRCRLLLQPQHPHRTHHRRRSLHARARTAPRHPPPPLRIRWLPTPNNSALSLPLKSTKPNSNNSVGHRLFRPTQRLRPQRPRHGSPPLSPVGNRRPGSQPKQPPHPHCSERDRRPLPPRRAHRRVAQPTPGGQGRSSNRSSSRRNRHISPKTCEKPDKTGKTRKKPVGNRRIPVDKASRKVEGELRYSLTPA